MDALSNPIDLVNQAISLGIDMLGISEHESLSSHIVLNKYAQEIKDEHPNFKIALGNEIYLTETREKNQKYYHFILCAKDAVGHKMLREMSSIAWINSFYDRGMQRVPLLYDELKATVKKYGQGHLIASTACIGSRLGQNLLKMMHCEQMQDTKGRKEAHHDIEKHLDFCKEVFQDDFYLEIAPALYNEQIYVNKKTLLIANLFDIKATIQDDSHRIAQEDYIAHKAFLNSKQGEREDIDSFYKYTYLQSYDDIRKHMEPVGCDCDELFKNSMEMYDKVESYSLLRPQEVTQVSVPNYPKANKETEYKHLNQLYQSDSDQERYWVNYCVDQLREKNIYNKEYLTELDEEARVQLVVGKKLGTCIFSYPIFLKHYFDLIWECGSCVGVGRGSSGAGLDNYLMNLTQYDPIKAGVNNYFRYLNDERLELPDLDFDLSPSVRPKWFAKIREERGELGLLQVCTFSTMSARAAILAACRGYRSAEYPNGIDNDQAQYLTSLVGSKRGFTYSITDMINGNKEKGIEPNQSFLKAVNQYDGLLNIIKKLEGTISNRSIHASGIIFNDKGHEFDHCAVMTAPDGTLITQWSLHDQEAAGKTKIDSLVTDVVEKITQCLLLLQEKNKVDANLTLRELYNKYIHPDVLPITDPHIWDEIDKGKINNLFQFDTQVGGQTVKKLKPRSIDELSAINALIRLMPMNEGDETPVERFFRIKNHSKEWDKEMADWGLSQKEQSIIKEYASSSYGTLPLQDDLMLMMMDDRLFGFSLKDANNARKIIGKKQMDKIPELHKKILMKAKNEKLGSYIYDVLFSEQLGYAFNREHCFSYSLIGFQCAFLAVHFPQIYWNTACLRVDSGLEESDSTDYGKIAKAVGKIKNQGINFSLIDINKSQYMFEPDETNDQIIYGLKALNGVGGELIQTIVNNRPYSSLQDFIEKTGVNKTAVISLIKSGAFDQFGSRKETMKQYIKSVSNCKEKLTMQNFNGLVAHDLIPNVLGLQKRVFLFNKELRKKYKKNNYYMLNNHNYYEFFARNFDIDNLVSINNVLCIEDKKWKKLYDQAMKPAKDYIKKHQKSLLEKYNNKLCREQWIKYALGNYAHWEMESLGMYYHPHELKRVNADAYEIVPFNSLSEEPIVDYTFRKKDKEIPIFKTSRIMGTVIAKDDMHSSISVLTPESGVVTVKFNRDYFAMYNKRISEVQKDGTKKLIEDSWFKRGTLVVLSGIRRNDSFFTRHYKNSNSHQIYKINHIDQDGMVQMTNLRCDQ